MSPAAQLIRAAVIDDEALARKLLRSLLEADGRFEVIGEADSGAAATRLIRAQRPDVIFLDIEMPGQTGMELAAWLRERDAPPIVFVTAYDRYALDAFGVPALDYLLKPIEKPRFRQCLDRIEQELRTRRIARLGEEIAAVAGGEGSAGRGESDTLQIRHQGGLLRLAIGDIVWLEGANQYTTVHTAGGDYVVSDSLRQVGSRLPGTQFLRVHRSAIVNVDCVTSVKGAANGTYRIRLVDGTTVTLARSRRDLLSRLVPRGS